MSTAEAERCIRASAPRVPQFHLVQTERRHLFVVDGSRLFEAEANLFRGLDVAAATAGSGEIEALF